MATARRLLCFLVALLLVLESVHGVVDLRRHEFNREDLDDGRYDDDRGEHEEDEEEERPYDRKKHKDEPKSRSPFVLEKPVEIARTDAGKIEVLPGLKDKRGFLEMRSVGLNFITMEPKALLLPQYIDAPCVLYVFKGRMRLGWVDNGLNQQDLEAGDIYVVPGGLVFYILNVDEAQRLRVFGMFDTSESLVTGHFQSSFVAGGVDPQTILSGFDSEVLAASFKVSPEEVSEMLSNQNLGPIIYTSKAQYEKLNVRVEGCSEASSWSWKNLLSSVSAQLFSYDSYSFYSNKREAGGSEGKPFNLLKKKPDFENDNGQTIAVDGDEYPPLRNASVGVFAVSLKPAAILAPHWNPRASEISLVTKGQGVIQISYPNGTSCLNKRVEEGSVFFVPRYFPMCQVASRDGPFEFVGFSTSANPNNPQFLAGASSVLRALDDETLSTAFAIPSEKLKQFVEQQDDAVILAGFVEDNSTSI